MGNLSLWLAVMLGGAAGSGARFGLNLLLRAWYPGFPLATLAVNAVGGLAMGAITAYAQTRPGFPEALRLGLTTGVLGGFTTFSAFSIETLLLWRDGQVLLAALNVGANLALSLGACALAYWLAGGLTPASAAS